MERPSNEDLAAFAAALADGHTLEVVTARGSWEITNVSLPTGVGAMSAGCCYPNPSDEEIATVRKLCKLLTDLLGGRQVAEAQVVRGGRQEVGRELRRALGGGMG